MLVIRKVVSAAVAVKFPQVPNPAGQAIQARRPEKATRKVRDQEGPPRDSGQEHAKTASAIRLADSMAAFWGRWAWAVGTSRCETWSEATPSPVTVQSPKCPRHLPPVLRLWSRRNDEIGNMGSASNGLLIAPFGSWILFQLSRGLEGHLQLSTPYKCPSLRLPKASGQPRHSGGTLMAVCSSCQSSRLPRRLVSQATSSIGSMRNGQLLLIPSSPQAPSSLGPVHVDQTQTQDPAVDCRWTSMVMRSRAHTVGRTQTERGTATVTVPIGTRPSHSLSLTAFPSSTGSGSG